MLLVVLVLSGHQGKVRLELAELGLCGRFEFCNFCFKLPWFLNFKPECVVEPFNLMSHSLCFFSSEPEVLGNLLQLLWEEGDFVLKFGDFFWGLIVEVHFFVLEGSGNVLDSILQFLLFSLMVGDDLFEIGNFWSELWFPSLGQADLGLLELSLQWIIFSGEFSKSCFVLPDAPG